MIYPSDYNTPSANSAKTIGSAKERLRLPNILLTKHVYLRKDVHPTIWSLPSAV